MLPVSTQCEPLGAVVSNPDVPGRVSVPEGDEWGSGHRRAARRRGSPVKTGAMGFAGTLAVIIGVVVALRSGGGSHDEAGAAPATSGADAATAVRQWSAGGGDGHLTALSRGVTAIGDDASADDVASLGQDCTAFQATVQGAQIYPAVPEPATQQHWSKALSLLAQSAADCADGSTAGNHRQIDKALKELHAGSTELDLASVRVNELSGG